MKKVFDRVFCVDCGTEYSAGYDSDGELITEEGAARQFPTYGCLMCGSPAGFRNYQGTLIPSYKPEKEELNHFIELTKEEIEVFD